MEPVSQPTEYEQLVAIASRVDQLMRELETWLHARESDATSAGFTSRRPEWRRRRLEVVRLSQALLAALLRDIEL